MCTAVSASKSCRAIGSAWAQDSGACEPRVAGSGSADISCAAVKKVRTEPKLHRLIKKHSKSPDDLLRVEGQLDLDGLVTKEYTLDGVNEGYEDMRAGKNIRGVMKYA